MLVLGGVVVVVAFVVEAQTHEENQAGFMQIHGCQCRSCFLCFS